MNETEIIEKLKNDEDYYGSFGKQFLSNSYISTLLTNPLAFGGAIKTIFGFFSRGLFSYCDT